MSTWEPITRQTTMMSDAVSPRATCTIGGAVARMIERAELDGRRVDELADVVTHGRITFDRS
jgi:hypothetical protein